MQGQAPGLYILFLVRNSWKMSKIQKKKLFLRYLLREHLPLFGTDAADDEDSLCCCFSSTNTDVGKLLTSTVVDNKTAKMVKTWYLKNLAIFASPKKRSVNEGYTFFSRRRSRSFRLVFVAVSLEGSIITLRTCWMPPFERELPN